MPRPLTVAGITNSGFKYRRLVPQIIIGLFGVLRPRSHAAWKTSQEVTHPKITPQQAHLTVEFCKSWLPEKKCAPLVI